jgi:hypothetical protein
VYTGLHYLIPSEWNRAGVWYEAWNSGNASTTIIRDSKASSSGMGLRMRRQKGHVRRDNSNVLNQRQIRTHRKRHRNKRIGRNRSSGGRFSGGLII